MNSDASLRGDIFDNFNSQKIIFIAENGFYVDIDDQDFQENTLFYSTVFFEEV